MIARNASSSNPAVRFNLDAITCYYTPMQLRLLLFPLILGGCVGEGPRGIAPAQEAVTTVKVDLFHKPLPDVPNVNESATLHLATVQGVRPGDTVLVKNLDSGETGCSYVSEQKAFRTAVPSDLGDRIEISFFSGATITGPECELSAEGEPYPVVKQQQEEIVFQGQTYLADRPLTALAEGMIDQARQQCGKLCAETERDDPCGCASVKPFDLGFFLHGLIGNYLASEGKDLQVRPCYGWNSCPDIPQPPIVRDRDALD